MIENLFVKNKKEFDKINSLLLKSIDATKKMPDYILRKKYKFLKFIDDYESFSSIFLDILKKFTSISSDDNFLIAVLKPDPEKYYYKHFGYYNYGVLPVNVTLEEYTEFLLHGPVDSPADAILYNSFRICWLSSSLKWVIYFDRECEISVIAYDDDIYNKIIETSGISYFSSIKEALNDNSYILDKLKEMLISNYSI